MRVVTKAGIAAVLLAGGMVTAMLAGIVCSDGVHADDGVLFRESFENLDAWEPLHFPGIERHSTYESKYLGGLSVVAATSSNSASALVCNRPFDVRAFPTIRWRWKVDNLYVKGNYRRKSGDDYPIRVYVFFTYDPKQAPLGLKLKYGLAKAIYGKYPPLCSVNYIWANHEAETEKVFSPFTKQSIMIPLEFGPQKVGQWVEEVVDVRQDYIDAFGGQPPTEAYLAIMSDSDNTGERASAYLDYIEVGR